MRSWPSYNAPPSPFVAAPVPDINPTRQVEQRPSATRLTKQDPESGNARTRLLEAARDVIWAQGFAATTVDDLCKAAGVTKGAFFHHFETKEALGLAAVDYWTETTSAFFADASCHGHEDPFERLVAYVEFRKGIIKGNLAAFTCLVGTMTQEIYGPHPAIRAAGAASLFGHAATLEPDIEATMTARRIEADWTPQALPPSCKPFCKAL